jgi:hypothetical protein
MGLGTLSTFASHDRCCVTHRVSTLSIPCRRAWTKIQMRCVLAARRSSIRSALHVLAYNLTRVMNIVGIRPFLAAIQA